MTMPITHGPTAEGPDSTARAGRSVDVLLVGVDGAAHRRRWTTDAHGGLLAQLQGAVGGLVDVVALADNLDVWVNDEGLYLCEPNPVATLLALALGRDAPLFGPAVFTGGADQQGDTVGLDPGTCEQLTTLVRLASADPTRLAAVQLAAVAFAARYR